MTKDLIKTSKKIVNQARIRLSRFIKDTGSLPAYALVMGIAQDGLPVLMNVKDSMTPNVVVWDRMAKQGLKILKVIAEYIFLHHKSVGYPKDKVIEFVVLTRYPEDWGELNEYGVGMTGKTSCIGIIPFCSKLAGQVMYGLAGWCSEPHRASKNPVIVLVDELENLRNCDDDFKRDFRCVQMLGRKKNVYVVGTASKTNFHQVQDWLDGFQAEIYGSDVSDTFEMTEGDINILFYAPKTDMI